MEAIVDRTCTQVPRDDSERSQDHKPLSAYRFSSAYVLLGDPGSGKTTEFALESRRLGDEAVSVTARDFLDLDSRSRTEWRDKTLFIDGLDEIRAGSSDARTPFGRIRRQLDELGRPRFRISCREADWLGENDRRHLVSVSPDSQVIGLRLDPLTDLDVVQMLEAHSAGIDAHAFMAEARNRGIQGLLYNPQSLVLLANVVGQDGGWPESRRETFEKACRQMADEHNEEHRLGQQRMPLDRLLDVAGLLCAVHLISGTAGYSIGRNEIVADFLPLDAIDNESHDALQRALSTKLFKSGATGRFIPVHRHVAEFLGARHLAQQINAGLPTKRVLSLITGGDGIVVTELRGLSAWLATHCQVARDHLVESDPIGVGLYGDISAFSAPDKKKLLTALNRVVSRLNYPPGAAAPFGPLATVEMEESLRSQLEDPDRGRDAQMLVLFLLEVLRYGQPLLSLSDTLIDIVYDDTRWPSVKRLAIHAFINTCRIDGERTAKLKELLADIHAKRISDPDDELLGVLLAELYPRDITPAAVWDYLHAEGRPEFIGAYLQFWDRDLMELSSGSAVAELLDELHRRLPGLRPALVNRLLERLPVMLLANALEAYGDSATPNRLYDWLSVGRFQGWDDAPPDDDSASRVRVWLQQRPTIQKDVVKEGISRWDGCNIFLYGRQVRQSLYASELPLDWGLWCLEQATKSSDDSIAGLFLNWAVDTVANGSNDEGPSLELLIKRTEHEDALKDLLASMLVCEIPPGHLEARERRLRRTRYIDRDQEDRRRWLDGVRFHVESIRENRAAHTALDEVGKAYYSRNPSLKDLLGSDSILFDDLLTGLRQTVWRTDVPESEEIIDAAVKSRRYHITLPFLAGMDEIERSDPEQLHQFPENQMRKALAFYFCTPIGRAQDAGWYKEWLRDFPKIVADVLTRYAKAAIDKGEEHIVCLYSLAHQMNHSEVARQASLPLLQGFPVRCGSNRLAALDYLLWAALQHADRVSLQELVSRKLSLKSMNVAQRVHWLSAGVFLHPDLYRQALEEFVVGHEDRTRQLASFYFPSDAVLLRSDQNQSSLLDSLGVPVIELLIRLVGRSFGPVGIPNGWVRVEHEAQNGVSQLIQHLASLPSGEAAQALESLCSDERLYKWRDALENAKSSQAVIRRDAMYRHPSAEQILRTLKNDLPANAGDLAALVLDCLEEIGERIRTGNTDDWRQYWSEDTRRHPSVPKHEDSCRDALLSDLRQRLPPGVDSQREGQYAAAKRSDIRAAHSVFNVPVEAKKNSHRDLWSAIRDQLIAKYTADPTTDGYGIYLVFWFGEEHTTSPPSGHKPRSAQELREQLAATLTDDEARKVSILVIDVSEPK